LLIAPACANRGRLATTIAEPHLARRAGAPSTIRLSAYNSFPSRPSTAPAEGEALNTSTNIVDFLQFLDADLADDEATTWARNNQTLALQKAGGLADRSTADAELLGKSTLDDALPW
jgi:hypothetical protein